MQELASVTEAPSHDASVNALRFTAVARIDLAGLKSWTVGGNRQLQSSTHTAALVPMVPPHWTADAAVPLWVRVDARTSSVSDPDIQRELEALATAASAGPITVTIAQHLTSDVDMDGTNAFQIGARRAMEEHGLESPIGTPLTTWPPAPGTLRLAE